MSKEYIEKEAFRQELIDTPFYPRCKTTPDLLTSVQDRLNDTIELLDNFPPADVKPVVRGEWISVPHKRARICSHCECDEPYKLAENDADVYNFCPNCGADMRPRQPDCNSCVYRKIVERETGEQWEDEKDCPYAHLNGGKCPPWDEGWGHDMATIIRKN